MFLTKTLLSSTKAPLALNLGLPAAEPQALQCGCCYTGSAMMTSGLPVLPSYGINACLRLFNHVTVYRWLQDTVQIDGFPGKGMIWEKAVLNVFQNSCLLRIISKNIQGQF